MKMARASKADLDAALDVSNIIEQLENGYMPSTDESDELERFDSDDREQCKRALAAILDAAEKGSLFRVTFGMTVVLDPRNELLDPAADTLELHPKLVAARDHAATPSEQQAEVTNAAHDVLAERRRQVDQEGWTPSHDDAHATGDMALAAACYAVADNENYPLPEPPDLWPWDPDWWKPTTERRNLVKAGALILAEIERLDRAAARAGGA